VTATSWTWLSRRPAEAMRVNFALALARNAAIDQSDNGRAVAKRRDDVEGIMTSDQLAEARRLVSEGLRREAR
jgi:hypothetical protein